MGFESFKVKFGKQNELGNEIGTPLSVAFLIIQKLCI